MAIVLALGVLLTAGSVSAAEPAGCAQQPAGPLLAGCARVSALQGATGVAVAPDGRRVFVAAAGSSALTSFARGTDGSLGFLGCVSDNGTDGNDGTDGRCTDGHALKGAKGLAVSPDGRHLYLAATSSGAIDTFSLEGDKPVQVGCLKESAIDSRCGDGRALAGARSLAVSPDGRNVYAAAAGSDAVTTLARDQASGQLAVIGCVSADGSDGACADGRGLLRPTGVTVSRDGRWVHVVAYGSSAVTTFARDPGDGHLTQTGCVMARAPRSGSCRRADSLAGASGLALSADGKAVIVAGRNAGAISILRLNPTTGDLTFAGCAAARASRRSRCVAARGLGNPTAVAVSPSGRTVLATSAAGGLAVLGRVAGDRPLRPLRCLTAAAFPRARCRRVRSLRGAAGVAVAPAEPWAFVTAAGANALQTLRLGADE